MPIAAFTSTRKTCLLAGWVLYWPGISHVSVIYLGGSVLAHGCLLTQITEPQRLAYKYQRALTLMIVRALWGMGVNYMV